MYTKLQKTQDTKIKRAGTLCIKQKQTPQTRAQRNEGAKITKQNVKLKSETLHY